MARKLTHKQRAFIEHYLITWNATEAARRAGYSSGSVRSIGSENLTKPNILREIERRLSELQMSSDEVLLRLSQMARADIGDFMDIFSTGYNLDLSKAKEKGLTHLIKKVKQKTVTYLAKSESGEDREVTELEIELHDPQSALVHLGRHFKLFTDKIEHVDWRTDVIDLIRSDQVTYDQVSREFGDDLTRELFESAGKEVVLIDND